MKKTHLFAATALLSALLVAGVSEAKTEAKAPAPEAKASTAVSGDQMPMMKGHMAMSKMSEAGQKIMKETMDKFHADNKSTMDAMQTKHQELQDIMKAPTFDKSAYLAKHEEIQSLMVKMASGRAEAMASAAEKMTAEDRAGMMGPGMMMHRGGRDHMGKMGYGPNGDCPMGNDGMGMMKDKGTATPAAPAYPTKK